jgi:hypothetical protein
VPYTGRLNCMALTSMLQLMGLASLCRCRRGLPHSPRGCVPECLPFPRNIALSGFLIAISYSPYRSRDSPGTLIFTGAFKCQKYVPIPLSESHYRFPGCLHSSYVPTLVDVKRRMHISRGGASLVSLHGQSRINSQL